MSVGPKIRVAFCVVLIAAGACGFIYGSMLYSSTFIQYRLQLPADERGVIAFAGQSVSARSYHFMLYQIDVKKETAKVEISGLQGVPQPFGFQFPYVVSDISPEGWKVYPNGTSTYVYCFECPEQLDLTWTGVIQQRTYSAYALVVPFSEQDVIKSQQVELLSELMGGQVKFVSINESYYTLSAALPEGASMQTTEPSPVHFGRASDRLWFYWDISSYYREGWHAFMGGIPIAAEPTVYVLFTMDGVQQDKENRLFLSGLALGIAIPIMTSGVGELIKDSDAIDFIRTLVWKRRSRKSGDWAKGIPL
jgi:hypothetical protein